MWKWLLTGGAVPVLLLLCGGFFLIRLRFAPFRAPGRMGAALLSPAPGGGIPPVRGLLLALAGTLGVGNFVGVASAITVGGAGAVFWMWVSALAAMILKYAEVLLAVSHRRSGKDGFFGGAYYYIKDRFRANSRLGTLVSGGFAAVMLLDALTMGCVIQVSAVSSSFEGVLGIPPAVTAVLLLLLTLPVVIRGARGISSLTGILVPVMTAGYLILSVTVLVCRRGEVGEAFVSIFREAFTVRGGTGGVIGVLTSQAVRTGTMRGLLSNEAGCGTAPTAHASADAKSPADQGILGIAEVFVDTIVLCTVTALVILVCPADVSLIGDPALLSVYAYSAVLGDWAGVFFAVAIFCFGYATLICWSGYGMECVRFLSPKKRWRGFYLVSLACCVALGALSAPGWIWDVSDFAIALLTTVNLLFLFLSRREIAEETDRWLEK